jgi:hypothetical protein
MPRWRRADSQLDAHERILSFDMLCSVEVPPDVLERLKRQHATALFTMACLLALLSASIRLQEAHRGQENTPDELLRRYLDSE